MMVTAALLALMMGAPPHASPAHWTVAPPKSAAAPGATFMLTLTAQIDPGWHIYALDEPEDGPIATQIGMAQGDTLTLLDVNESQPKMVTDPVLKEATGMFENSASFTLKLRAPAKAAAASATSHIMVRYQSCNDKVCLPPHTETIVLPLAGVVR